jgi:hypothetical protein
MKKLSLLFAVLLAGCGSGSYNPPPVAQNPEPVADLFVAQVTAVVAATPDDADATSIDASVPSAPEESDPSAL